MPFNFKLTKMWVFYPNNAFSSEKLAFLISNAIYNLYNFKCAFQDQCMSAYLLF